MSEAGRLDGSDDAPAAAEDVMEISNELCGEDDDIARGYG